MSALSAPSPAMRYAATSTGLSSPRLAVSDTLDGNGQPRAVSQGHVRITATSRTSVLTTPSSPVSSLCSGGHTDADSARVKEATAISVIFIAITRASLGHSGRSIDATVT